ncbi:histidine phosphatase family protein [Streptomyces sp. SP18BB07]|uniref:histidine phosphatase family protein n=1 Tax=Streptomyces sp. SP18BB07 TaxID=3002522 RepID=UPI002E79F777|nr:histidine phosphatase family protein [Streptomyces sp. SP18BB07]MEE1759622.1 histidine phosphatase family protein [Streptomyces sp. SP18BB07]
MVRHGQSTANVAYDEAERTGSTAPLPGRGADVPLSDLGRAQAVALGGWLAGLTGAPEPNGTDAVGPDGVGPDPAGPDSVGPDPVGPDPVGPDLVVCSPYVRARQTWEVMAGHPGAVPPPLLVDERLRDREMGMFEMHPPAALRARAPEEAARRARTGEWFYRPPGGEALADVVLRVRDFVGELDRVTPGRRVLLIAHDAIAVAVRLVCAGLGATAPDRLPPVPNASVSRWENDGRRLRLARWGDTTHLAPPSPADSPATPPR